jgi:hypothetical protein
MSCNRVRYSGFRLFAQVSYQPQRLTASEILQLMSHNNSSPGDMLESLDGEHGVQEDALCRASVREHETVHRVTWKDEWVTFGFLHTFCNTRTIMRAYGLAVLQTFWLICSVFIGI